MSQPLDPALAAILSGPYDFDKLDAYVRSHNPLGLEIHGVTNILGRGWLIVRLANGQWVDLETGKPGRACRRCGRPPLPTGEDACLGHIPGAVEACCGHGVEDGYVLYPDANITIPKDSTPTPPREIA